MFHVPVDRCRETAGSGLGFGLCCVGSSAGLMAMLAALVVMSAGWMAVIAGRHPGRPQYQQHAMKTVNTGRQGAGLRQAKMNEEEDQ